MRRITFILISIGLLFLSVKIFSRDFATSSFTHVESDNSTVEKLLKQVSAIKKLVRSNPNYNKEIAFFIDMKIMSGKNRFFIYDLKNDSIIDQGLVAHGLGSKIKVDGSQRFSNENSSFCTALGKYSIGKSYQGKFGKAYKLYGLENTNNNAFMRNIVLHKFESVPYEEQQSQICHSLGCPMVNETYYKRIEKLIDNSKKNIILDIYY